jgi:hypothetical protein
VCGSHLTPARQAGLMRHAEVKRRYHRGVLSLAISHQPSATSCLGETELNRPGMWTIETVD